MKLDALFMSFRCSVLFELYYVILAFKTHFENLKKAQLIILINLNVLKQTFYGGCGCSKSPCNSLTCQGRAGQSSGVGKSTSSTLGMWDYPGPFGCFQTGEESG